MNGAFIVFEPINEDKPDGIQRKMILQKEAFEKAGINMRFVLLQEVNGKYWRNPEQFSDDQFIYFRRETVIEWNMIRFLKEIRKQDPKKVIFMEIPTYPYDGEFGPSLKSQLTLKVDMHYRKQLRGLVDRVIITGDTISSFYETDVINIVNGIDFNIIHCERKEKKEKEIVIGCVGRLSKWHGYERLLKGLSAYYLNGGEDTVRVLVVGEGPEKENYIKVTDELNLRENVEFTGFKTGRELESIYESLDFGCCSLGRYKSGMNMIGDLKSRDFLARGIPIILGCKLDIFADTEFEYAVSFPNDSSDIDINKLINFYHEKLENKREEVSRQIIESVKPLIDFNITYKKVTDCARSLLSLT